MNPLTINWKYTGGGTTFYDAGASENPVYITLTNPATANMYRTVVHLACSNPGATTSNSAVANTWALFAGPANVNTWDGTALTYYATDDGGLCTATACLLSTHEGQCHSFADLLRDCFMVNGATGVAITRIRPPTGHNAFGVKNIGTLGTSYTPPYQYDESDLDITVAGIPGQNTNPPKAKLFSLHFILHRGTGTEYYDPSYGVTTTGAADYTSNIAFWRRSSDFHWRDASGAGLELIFTDDP